MLQFRAVAENVYTRLLKQLVSIEGSTQAVCSLLRVPEGTLVWWMNGRAQMPLRALLRAVDLVAKHELKDQPDTLTFCVGPVRGRCAACGSEQFRRKDPRGSHTYHSALACMSCGQEVVQGDLVVQVAREASLQAAKKVRSQSKT